MSGLPATRGGVPPARGNARKFFRPATLTAAGSLRSLGRAEPLTSGRVPAATQPRLLTSRGAVASEFRRRSSSRLWLIAEDLVVGRLEQLLAAVAELGADGLLHPRIGQLALSRRFLAKSASRSESP